MKRAGRLTTALVLAGTVASGILLGSARLEAKGKGGGDGTICSSLLAIITYKYTSPTIRDYTTGLYLAYKCDPTLLPK